ncbi:hypothetical protein [Psychroserpens sp.]|uniref:hypothetical protein n=1 Tax=Psychroserpens sp. TaxID=2020870 RepID=UPI001B262969|nr:hypothetical protein [Psychroserpens sp.]MBO6605232.1 hypothetical protein [Psychroserpens sp.]MBO6653959.1 hypothetical protein [Psychroserpens sp.]MBO6682280.1 hypothetical protein [Psychroserpens sp.]MBO6748606.1 hypothetical protein [Psychroserpens sp.]MBO6915125.1 hypothetical protein [Psychroserpens sp.]
MNSNMLRLKLKRIDPVKYAIVATLVYLLILLIVYVPIILIASLAGGMSDIGAGAAMLGGGIIGIIFAIIFMGIFVFIITLIACSLLNFILKKTGGIDIDFEKAGLSISEIGEDRRIEQ